MSALSCSWQMTVICSINAKSPLLSPVSDNLHFTDGHYFIPIFDQSIHFKGTRSYVSKLSFLILLKNHHSKDVNLKFQLKRLSLLDVRSNFVYSSRLYIYWRCKLNYGTFSLISSKGNNFQLWNLPWVMRKIWAFLWYQNIQKFEKNKKNKK